MQVRRRLGFYFVLLITFSTLTTNALASCPSNGAGSAVPWSIGGPTLSS